MVDEKPIRFVDLKPEHFPVANEGGDVMATCPSCGVKSREDPEALVIEEVIVLPRALGTFSVSGSTFKLSANRHLLLRCEKCDWSVLGYLDGDHFVAYLDE